MIAMHRETLEVRLSTSSKKSPIEIWIWLKHKDITKILPNNTPVDNNLPFVVKKYWKLIGEDVLEMNQTEKDAVDQAEADATAQAETDSKDFTKSISMLDKAVELVNLDEFNTVRGWITDFKVEVSAATSLADLKTRIAGLPSMADRTINQLKTAIANKYDSLS